MEEHQLFTFEYQILREVAGELPSSFCGAATWVTLEYLYKTGYTITPRGDGLTPKGRNALDRYHRANGTKP